jgi:hypothetical protein
MGPLIAASLTEWTVHSDDGRSPLKVTVPWPLVSVGGKLSGLNGLYGKRTGKTDFSRSFSAMELPLRAATR